MQIFGLAPFCPKTPIVSGLKGVGRRIYLHRKEGRQEGRKEGWVENRSDMHWSIVVPVLKTNFLSPFVHLLCRGWQLLYVKCLWVSKGIKYLFSNRNDWDSKNVARSSVPLVDTLSY